jgi:hypothetical protein
MLQLCSISFTVPASMAHLRVFATAILFLLALTGCGARHTVLVASPPEPAYAEQELDVFALAAGHWDRARGDSTCLGNTHTISFSADRQQMLLTFREPVDTATMQRVVRYRVLAAGPQLHRESPFAIRAAMENEERRTDAGELVVWDLIMASVNRYHWHRTDWQGLALTGAVVRCAGTTPLERWEPSAQNASP